jgi:tetratricopeptide (TPR) repeat protein
MGLSRSRTSFSIVFCVGALAVSGCGHAESGYSMGAAHEYQARGDYQGLYRYGQDWVHADSGSGFAWYIAGKGALELGRNEEAARALARSVELLPDAAIPYADLAAAYTSLGQAQRSIQTIADGEAKAGPKASAYQWYMFGNARLVFRQFPEAVADYRRTLALYPNSGEAWNNLGTAYQQIGDFTDALNAYERASSLGNSLAVGNAQTLREALSRHLAPARAGDPSCDAFCQKHFENQHRAFEGESLLK